MKNCILFAAIVTFSSIAQAQTNETTSGANARDTNTTSDQRGFNPGWLGLLGLGGLAGLMRKNEERDSTRSNIGTTSRV